MSGSGQKCVLVDSCSNGIDFRIAVQLTKDHDKCYNGTSGLNIFRDAGSQHDYQLILSYKLQMDTYCSQKWIPQCVYPEDYYKVFRVADQGEGELSPSATCQSVRCYHEHCGEGKGQEQVHIVIRAPPPEVMRSMLA